MVEETKATSEHVDEKECRQISQDSMFYPSASIMLEVSKDEYTKERERTNNLDNKANVFISAMLAIITLYIPIIPFKEIKGVYMHNEKFSLIMVTVSVCVLLLAFAYLSIAFYNLYKAFSLKPFFRVEFENLNDEQLLQQPGNKVERGLINHYNLILNRNADINDNKAKKLSTGIKKCIIGFALLSLATISLLIIVG